MTTALDIIKISLRLLGITSLSEGPGAAEGMIAFNALNRMLHGFPADGIQFAHTTITSQTANIPVPPEEEQHVAAMLAVFVAPELEETPSPLVLLMAENARRYLQGAYLLPKTAPVDSLLLPDRSGLTVAEWERG